MENYEDYIENKKLASRPSINLFNKVKPFHIILLLVLFFLAYNMTKNNPDNKFLWYIIAVFGILYIYSLMRQQAVPSIIPRHIGEEIALNDLKRMISSNGAYPIGTKIYPTGKFKDQSADDGTGGMKLFKYRFGFTIKEPDRPAKEIIYIMNPNNGLCKGIEDTPTGFFGQDIKDIKLIFPEVFQEKEKK